MKELWKELFYTSLDKLTNILRKQEKGILETSTWNQQK